MPYHYKKNLYSPQIIKLASYYVLKYPHKLKALWRIIFDLERRKAQYHQCKPGGLGAPYVVTVRLTNKCNLRCVQCGQWGDKGYYRNGKNQDMLKNELTTQQWKAFIDSLAPYRPYLAFYGGEPFIRSDLTHLVRYATDRGLLTWVSTNGVYLSSKADDIVLSGLDYLYVSLDGPDSLVNDAIRPGSGGFKEIEQGIKDVVAAKKRHSSQLPLIELQMTIIKENQQRIKDMSDLALKLGVDGFYARFPIFNSPGSFDESNERFKAEFGKDLKYTDGFMNDFDGIDTGAVERQIRQVKSDWKDRYSSLPCGEDFDIGRHYRSCGQNHKNKDCVTPWVRAQVMANGDVVFCEDYPELVCGNITEQDFLSIWNGKTAWQWRNFIKEKGILPICLKCCGLYEIPFNRKEPSAREVQKPPAAACRET